ncbi:hypothetical protein KFU94_56990 [Chloroflexi bacterium TSY]|nr:hypothetical protein [Chloroflexi bacterium TSY]MBV7337578.1 hypothetical protein [Chloroflexi bacterium TSY]
MMAAVPPTELLRQWELEQITPEMAIGQLIQNQVKQQELLELNSRTLSIIRFDVDSLNTHTGLPPRDRGNRKHPKQS